MSAKNESYAQVETTHPLEGYRVYLAFEDGKRGIFDMNPYLEMEAFSAIRSLEAFETVRPLYGTAAWLGGRVDIAPETLYEGCQEVEPRDEWEQPDARGEDAYRHMFGELTPAWALRMLADGESADPMEPDYVAVDRRLLTAIAEKI